MDLNTEHGSIPTSSVMTPLNLSSSSVLPSRVKQVAGAAIFPPIRVMNLKFKTS